MKMDRRKIAKVAALSAAIAGGVVMFTSPYDAQAYSGGKITCHSSSSPAAGYTYTQCSTCSSAAGTGSDAGQCRP